MSGRSDRRGRAALFDYLVRLAIDPRALGAFVTNPRGAAANAGLTATDRSTLFSGDQNRIYAALATPRRQSSRARPKAGH